MAALKEIISSYKKTLVGSSASTDEDPEPESAESTGELVAGGGIFFFYEVAITENSDGICEFTTEFRGAQPFPAVTEDPALTALIDSASGLGDGMTVGDHLIKCAMCVAGLAKLGYQVVSIDDKFPSRFARADHGRMLIARIYFTRPV